MTTNPCRTPGERMRFLRSSLGISQADLGALLDPPVQQGTVSKWENDRIEPRRHHKAQLIRVLKTHQTFLFPLEAA